VELAGLIDWDRSESEDSRFSTCLMVNSTRVTMEELANFLSSYEGWDLKIELSAE
jgi:hypothetical protein